MRSIPKLLLSLVVALTALPVFASSHREAPIVVDQAFTRVSACATIVKGF